MVLSLRSALQFQNTGGRALLHQRFVTVLTADSFSICSQSHTQNKTFTTSLALVTMIINDCKIFHQTKTGFLSFKPYNIGLVLFSGTKPLIWSHNWSLFQHIICRFSINQSSKKLWMSRSKTVLQCSLLEQPKIC